MKLVSYDAGRGPAVGIAVGDDVATARLVEIVGDDLPAGMPALLADGDRLLPALRERVEQAEIERARPLSEVRLLPPVPRPGKVICVGQNYRDHCDEQNQPYPTAPILFTKFGTSLIADGEPIVKPRIVRQMDYEVELAVVIGRRGKDIPEAEALSHVGGYTIVNDVTARELQKADGQWVRAKSFDTFGPMGPWIVTADEIPDPGALDISLTVNGERRQDSNTKNLIFSVPYLIHYASLAFTLEPGDLISTGTPGGVGIYSDPPRLLEPGDTVSATVERIGTLTNPVAAPGQQA